jgi:hypothetical protein
VTPDQSVAWRCGGAPVPGGAPSRMPTAAYTGGTLFTLGLTRYLPAACRP